MILQDFLIDKADKQTVVSRYRCLKDGTGFVKGDILKLVQCIDPTTGTVSSEYWYNEDTNTVVATPPVLPTEAEALDNKRMLLGDESVKFAWKNISTLTIPSGANHAEIHVINGDVLFTVAGTAPAPGAVPIGYRQRNGATFELESLDELNGFQGTALNDGGAGIFYVTYFCEFDDND